MRKKTMVTIFQIVVGILLAVNSALLWWASHSVNALKVASKSVVRQYTQPIYADKEMKQELPLVEVYTVEQLDALKNLALEAGYSEEQWETADFPE